MVALFKQRSGLFTRFVLAYKCAVHIHHHYSGWPAVQIGRRRRESLPAPWPVLLQRTR